MASILIVDDEAEIREMLKQMFTLENYMVYTAKDGQEALDKVSALMGKASVAEDIQAFDENARMDISL